MEIRDKIEASLLYEQFDQRCYQRALTSLIRKSSPEFAGLEAHPASNEHFALLLGMDLHVLIAPQSAPLPGWTFDEALSLVGDATARRGWAGRVAHHRHALQITVGHGALSSPGAEPGLANQPKRLALADRRRLIRMLHRVLFTFAAAMPPRMLHFAPQHHFQEPDAILTTPREDLPVAYLIRLQPGDRAPDQDGPAVFEALGSEVLLGRRLVLRVQGRDRVPDRTLVTELVSDILNKAAMPTYGSVIQIGRHPPLITRQKLPSQRYPMGSLEVSLATMEDIERCSQPEDRRETDLRRVFQNTVAAENVPRMGLRRAPQLKLPGRLRRMVAW